MVLREQHGFHRTRCGCAFCAAPCRYLPGSLAVDDLEQLCPPGQDVFVWAEEHLRALVDKPVPTLVPTRRTDGSCHWLLDGLCAVHANAPFGCAFFDTHMSNDEIERRSAASVEARRADAGLYHKVWLYLCRRGLVGRPGDRAGLAAEWQRLRQK